VFVVDAVGGSAATAICAELRAAGFGADRAYDEKSMKSQMKSADRSGAKVAIIVGEDERTAGAAILRTMEDGLQQTVQRGDLVATVRRMLGR
jgi:histidyl-tRNA synthetase